MIVPQAKGRGKLAATHLRDGPNRCDSPKHGAAFEMVSIQWDGWRLVAMSLVL